MPRDPAFHQAKLCQAEFISASNWV